MRVLFLDCFSGISGDMTVGALCDLGVKPSTFEWELAKLDIGDFHMHFERRKRQHLDGVKFGIHSGSVHTHDQDEEPDEHGQVHVHAAHAHDHDHDHADGHAPVALDDEEACDCGHDHDHDHAHDHDHEHVHAPVHSHEPPREHLHTHALNGGRTHAQIRALISESDLSPYVREHALGIFQRIAVAEAKIHGVPVETIAFHEVGALDSIADIICACVGLEELGVERIYVGPLADGRGWVDCAHGRFPIPALATLEILRGVAPVGQIDEPFEFITPTGAAIAAEFGVSFGPMPRMKIEKIGYGFGSRQLADRPNALRAVLGELVDGRRRGARSPRRRVRDRHRHAD